MKNPKQGYSAVHPMVIFWLGVLTGAIIVGLAFFYRFVLASEYQSALLNFSKYGSGSGITWDSGDPAAGKSGDPAAGKSGDPAAGSLK